jgi:hypothetical protein
MGLRNSTIENKGKSIEMQVSERLSSVKSAILKDAELLMGRVVISDKLDRQRRSLSTLLFAANVLGYIAEIAKKGELIRNESLQVEVVDKKLIITAIDKKDKPEMSMHIQMGKEGIQIVLESDKKQLLSLALQERSLQKNVYTIVEGHIVHENVDPWYVQTEAHHQKNINSFNRDLSNKKNIFAPIAQFVTTLLR